MAPVTQHPTRSGRFRPIGKVAAEIVADLHFRRQVQCLHHRGDRVLGEYLAELGAERSIMTLIIQKLERYAELETEALEATGGDRFWTPPIRKIRP